MITLAVAAVLVPVGAFARAIQSDGSGATSIHDLEIGDCFARPGSAATPSRGEDVSSVDVLPCDVPHVYELVDVVALQHPSDADFPGADALFEYGSQGCAEDFDEIVGTPLPQSALQMVLITPLGEGWDEGDREILCVAVRDDGRPLEQTVIGSGL
jgi:Septum formation